MPGSAGRAGDGVGSSHVWLAVNLKHLSHACFRVPLSPEQCHRVAQHRIFASAARRRSVSTIKPNDYAHSICGTRATAEGDCPRQHPAAMLATAARPTAVGGSTRCPMQTTPREAAPSVSRPATANAQRTRSVIFPKCLPQSAQLWLSSPPREAQSGSTCTKLGPPPVETARKLTVVGPSSIERALGRRHADPNPPWHGSCEI